MSESVIASPIIEYPESDGKPVGETDVHRREILHTIETLERHFRNVPDIYVSGNLMFYYEEGNPSAVVSPDVFVVKGVRKGLRRTYKLWDEGVAPCVVIEMTSRSTRLEDKGNKRALYALARRARVLSVRPAGGIPEAAPARVYPGRWRVCGAAVSRATAGLSAVSWG
jgi:Uma2 family endonuclease